MRRVLLAAAVLVVASCSGAQDETFEDRVRTYLETESRYRHTLDWRGEIKSIRCGEAVSRADPSEADGRSDARRCEIEFAKIGVEPWSVSPVGAHEFLLVPHGNNATGFVAN